MPEATSASATTAIATTRRRRCLSAGAAAPESHEANGRWKYTAMLERYINDGARWDDSDSVGIGL